MKTAVLVNPPNHQTDLLDVAPPLGLMVLAEIAINAGWEARILDLALPSSDFDVNEPTSFYERATQEILAENPQLVCLTSMGVNTHVAIELGRHVRAHDSTIPICAGGAHFSTIADAAERFFPWLDTIACGEGETAFRHILDDIDKYGRSGGPRQVRIPNQGLVARHPHDVYDQIPLSRYFACDPDRNLVCYEGGRGCIFKCSFCYSPSHYDSPRDLSPDDIVSDWSKLAVRGVSHIFMVQDNFTNDPNRAIAICDKLADAELPITWNGYATLPQLTPDLIAALGRAKCRQIYLGVDAVTENQRISFNKRFYRGSDSLLTKLQMLLDAGVEPTVAFMLDLFDYDEDEAESVFRVAADCSAIGVSIRLNTFTRYPGSGLASPRNPQRYSEAKVATMFDCPRVVRENPLARVCPWAFPFHTTELSDERLWVHRLRMVWLAQRFIQAYPDDLQEIAAGSENPINYGLDRLASDRTIWENLGTLLAEAAPTPDFEIY